MGPDQHVNRQRQAPDGAPASLAETVAGSRGAELVDEIRRQGEINAIIQNLDNIFDCARERRESVVKLLTLDTCAHGQREHKPGFLGVLGRLASVLDFEPIPPTLREHMNSPAYERLWDHLTARKIRFAFQNANRNFQNAVSLNPGFELYVAVPGEEYVADNKRAQRS